MRAPRSFSGGPFVLSLSIVATSSGCSVNDLDVLSANPSGGTTAAGGGAGSAGRGGEAGTAGGLAGSSGAAGRVGGSGGAGGAGASSGGAGSGGAGSGGAGSGGSSGGVGAASGSGGAVAGNAGSGAAGGGSGAGGSVPVAGAGGIAQGGGSGTSSGAAGGLQGGLGGGGVSQGGSGGSVQSGGSGGFGGSGGSGGFGGSGGSGGGGQGGQGGAGQVACPFLFVSAKGSDGSSGCSETEPLASIGAALARARQRNGAPGVDDPVGAIFVCAGSYEAIDPLVIDFPVSLLGSFDCAASPWQPPLVGATTLVPPTTHVASGSSPMLTVRGAVVNRSSVVSDIDFAGSDGVRPSAVGVHITDGSTVTFRHNRVRSSPGTSLELGTAAMVVDLGGAPALIDSLLTAAAGTLSASADPASQNALAASAGLYLASTAGSMQLLRSRITGGTGVSMTDRPGSVGVLSRAVNLAVDDSDIAGGNGTIVPSLALSDNAASIGLEVRATGVTQPALFVRRSTVRAGVGIAGGGGIAIGLVASGVVASLERARIYGGDAVAEGSTISASVGIYSRGGSLAAVNLLVHGGGLTPPSGSPGTNATRAFVLESVNFEGHHVTALYGKGTLNALGFYVVDAAVRASLNASLLVAESEAGAAFFLASAACQSPGAPLFTLTRVMVAQPGLESTPASNRLTTGDLGCPQGNTAASLPSPFYAGDRIGIVLPPDPDSVPVYGFPFHDCTTNDACASELFEAYGNAERLAAVLSGTGLAPTCGPASTRAPAPMRGGGVTSLSEDLNGAARGQQPSLGALEVSCKTEAPGW